MRYFTLWVFEKRRPQHFSAVRQFPADKVLWGSHFVQKETLEGLEHYGEVRAATLTEVHDYVAAFNGDVMRAHHDGRALKLR